MCQPHAVAATDPQQSDDLKLGRERFSLLVLEAYPLGDAVGRGPASHVAPGFRVQGADEAEAGTLRGHRVLL